MKVVDLLQVGAHHQRLSHNHDGWRSMDMAPRDGTWVELKCSYGVAPWYCVARWTDEQNAYRFEHGSSTGTKVKFKALKPSWVTPEGGGPFDENSLHWRPYAGDVNSYVDPTGGAQNDSAYWRGAVASKHGLPLTTFEAMYARNIRAQLPWWKRIFA